MTLPQTAFLHYTAPPIIGGVEVVIQAHVEAFVEAAHPVAVVAGRGEAEALAPEADFVLLPQVDSRHPRVAEMSRQLEGGQVPPGFEAFVDELVEALASELAPFDNVIAHNVLTKRFNLPLTAALFRLLDAGEMPNLIAWCHDFDWTSPRSRAKLHSGYPWDLLRTYRPDVTYVVVSKQRQEALVDLLDCSEEEVRVVYNGVDAQALLGLTDEGAALVERLRLLAADLVLLMPVRVTQAKNVEYALHTVAALKAGGIRPKLVLTGPPDPHDAKSMGYFRKLQSLRADLGVEEEMRFVFESGPEPDEPYTIGSDVVGDLFRTCDLMFMPSHREGFGMPVLEAGLAGVPVVSSAVPAAVEIGGEDVIRIGEDEEPEALAGRLLAWADGNPVHQLRKRVRQKYTWSAIFERDIRPLLKRET